MVFLGKRRELPHVEMARTLLTELPEEQADCHKNRDGKLLGHLFGVRDAGGHFGVVRSGDVRRRGRRTRFAAPMLYFQVWFEGSTPHLDLASR